MMRTPRSEHFSFFFKIKSIVFLGFGLLLIVTFISPNTAIEAQSSNQPLNGGAMGNRCPAYPAPVVPAPIRTRYVSATAVGGGNGLTSATPWTLTEANSNAQPGDLFLLRGTFSNNSINPAVNGTSTNKITYRKEPGQTAKFVPPGAYGSYLRNSLQHVVIDGIEFEGESYPLYLYSTNNVWFRNIYLHDGGQLLLLNADDIRIEDSQFNNIGSLAGNSGDAINLTDDSDNVTIVRNQIGNAGHDGINSNLQNVNQGSNDNLIIAHNTITNRWSGGIILSGKTTNALVECNTIQNSGLDNPNAGSRMNLSVHGQYNTIRYNLLKNAASYALLVSSYTFGGVNQHSTDNKVYNNTIINAGGSGIFIANHGGGLTERNLIANNLISGSYGADGANGNRYDIVVDTYSVPEPQTWNPSRVFGNLIKNNNVSTGTIKPFAIFRNPSVVPGGNLYYDTIAQMETAFPAFSGNLQINPLFTNSGAGDYTLQSTSPMIDAGTIISGQVYNGAAPDIGAFERGSVSPTQTPFPGPNAPNAPTTIEVENFDKGGEGIAYHESFGTTGSGVYRSNPLESVDIQARSTASNGYAVFEAAAGEWLEYTVNVPTAGNYNLGVSYSSEFNNGTFHIEVDGVNVTGQLTAISTGSWSTFQTITTPNVNLSAGQHILRLALDSNATTGCACVVGNFDKITLQAATQAKAIVFNGTNYAVTSQTLPSNFDSLGGFQFIWRVRGAGTSGWQFGAGGAYVVNGSPNYILADHREGFNVYMPPSNYSDSICKVQFDPANSRWTFETWKADGTGYVSRTQTISNTTNLQLSGGNVSFGGNSYGYFLGQSKIDYWGWIHRVEPLGNFPGTTLPSSVNYLLKYEFDNNGNDSSGTGINLTLNGSPTFENTP